MMAFDNYPILQKFPATISFARQKEPRMPKVSVKPSLKIVKFPRPPQISNERWTLYWRMKALLPEGLGLVKIQRGKLEKLERAVGGLAEWCAREESEITALLLAGAGIEMDGRIDDAKSREDGE